MPHGLSDHRGESHDTEPLLEEEETYGLEPLELNGISDSRSHRRLARLSQDLDDGLAPKKRSHKHRDHAIAPLFSHFQTIPLDFLDKLAPTPARKAVALALAFIGWLLLFSALIARGAATAPIEDYGSPKRLSCTSAPWPNDDKSCGVNGSKCLPFGNASFAFRCPPDCASVKVLEPNFVGDHPIQYNPWVIGGSLDAATTAGVTNIYRGDSWICSAALHAGIIDNSLGGCGRLSLIGEHSTYSGTERNGIKSIDFEPSFPMAFTLEKLDDTEAQCYDPRWATLFLSLLLTVGVSLFSTSPRSFFFTTFVVGYLQVALASDMPDFEEYLLVVQYALSRFLPGMFVGFAIYCFCAKKTLNGLEAQFEKTILWLGGFWFGALENYTLDKLPLSRLTPRDFAQPGAWIVFIVVVAIIAVAAISQARSFWIDGRFYRYLTIYGILATSLTLFALLPGLNLRIHHYILALLLLPGTAIQTRSSLLFQGFLVGLFINGVARWGFASILETDHFLADKGLIGSPLPEVLRPLIDGANITLSFPSVPKGWDGISVQVNDVERFRWPAGQGVPIFSWTRIKDEPYYFRFGYFRMEFIKGFLQGDYTHPTTWAKNGTWIVQNITRT